MGQKVGTGIRLEEATGRNLYIARWILWIDILGTLISDNVALGRLVTINLGDPDVHLYTIFAVFLRHIEADDLA